MTKVNITIGKGSVTVKISKDQGKSVVRKNKPTIVKGYFLEDSEE